MWFTRYAAVSVVVLVMSSTACSSAAPDDTLTVRDTVGAVFLVGKHGTLWNYYARANPDAKPSLYAIVNDKELAKYHKNAIRIIGYIGDASDATRLERSVHRDFKGGLSSEERNAIVAIFDALAIMSRRGVPEATQVLDKMLVRSYWKDISFRWRSETVKSPLTTVDQLVSYVLWAHARTGRTDDLEDKLNRVLKEVDDEKRRELMAKRNSMKELLGIGQRMRATEKAPISRQLRQQLPTAFNGDLSNPEPRGTDKDTSAPAKPEATAPQNDAGDAKEFLNAVAPAFDAWMELHKQEQELRLQLGHGIRESQKYKDLAAQKGAARQAFTAAVATHWPYETGGATAQMLEGAGEALSDARRFASDYRHGKGSRDVTMAKWLSIADRFPGTIEHDEALFMGGMLYLQHLRPGVEIDIPAARRIYERLARRPGPPSQWTLRAEENLVSFADDPTQRMTLRSQFVKDAANRLDREWLRRHMLVPTKQSTPDRLVRQIDEFLVILSASRKATAHNMLSDAKGTPDRFENLKRLKEEHADDPFVEAAFSWGAEAPTTSFWKYLLSVGLGAVAVAGAIWGGIVWRRRRVEAIVNAQPPDAPRRRPKR